jgi:hypothetical protein
MKVISKAHISPMSAPGLSLSHEIGLYVKDSLAYYEITDY